MLRRSHIIVVVLTILIVLSFLARHNAPSPLQQRDLAPINTTLGFGSILAVARPHSQRIPGLLWAANLTDLQIEVPAQPAWTDVDLHSFRLDSGSKISEGSARAWLGHLHVLKHFLQSAKETALILEDDADFDTSIRSHQIPLLASKLRELLGEPLREQSHWPDAKEWDILYPGHCDDALPSLSNPILSKGVTHEQTHTLYFDATTPPHALLHPDTSNFLHALRVPEHTRILHRTLAPLCTVAYAVHRRSAAAIVEQFKRERVGVDAFDVQLLRACSGGWRCWSVSPEVFHHVDGQSEIAGVDSGVSGGGGGAGEISGYVTRGLGKGTWNVRCGARHVQLWVEEEDVGGRKEAQSMMRDVLEKGEGCLIDLVTAQRSWRGCEWGECGAQS